MKVSLIALACAALLGATTAMADGRRGDYGHGYRDRHGSNYGDRHDRDDRRDRRGYDRDDRDRRYGHHDRDDRDDRYRHNWRRRGGHYNHGHHGGYVVREYGHHHLRHPGRGHHWVRHGDEFLLVAIASGLIADVIVNGH